MSRRVRLVAGSDSSACIGAVTKGYSKKLAYLEKHQRISLSSTHEVFFESLARPPAPAWSDDVAVDEDECGENINMLVKLPTARNRGDIFTKPLEYVSHWGHVQRLGMSVYGQPW